MLTRTTQMAALTGAILGWGALALQFVILRENIQSQGGTSGLAAWRFFGYFTILTNILVAIILSHATVRPKSNTGPGTPSVRLSVATAIAMVGIVYSIALREMWNPQGWQKVADAILHDVMPAGFVLFFLFCSHRTLRWRDAVYALILPSAYVVFAFARDAIDGSYPYHFLDPTKLSTSSLALNGAALLLAFLIVALLLIGATQLTWGRSKISLSTG